VHTEHSAVDGERDDRQQAPSGFSPTDRPYRPPRQASRVRHQDQPCRISKRLTSLSNADTMLGGHVPTTVSPINPAIQLYYVSSYTTPFWCCESRPRAAHA